MVILSGVSSKMVLWNTSFLQSLLQLEGSTVKLVASEELGG